MGVEDEVTKRVREAIENGKVELNALVEKAKAELLQLAEQLNAEADKQADKGLDWLKASKWTALILAGSAIIFGLFVYL